VRRTNKTRQQLTCTILFVSEVLSMSGDPLVTTSDVGMGGWHVDATVAIILCVVGCCRRGNKTERGLTTVIITEAQY
jgi:hypothetical protein